ncbi:MAG TPA: DUF2785 domain-containing protein [Ktedonobacteraceae bacterium]|jgi:hypothetical protein
MVGVRELTSSKVALRSIADNDYTLPEDIDAFECALTLLSNLSSTDEELRDELSYMLLARGVLAKRLLNSEQLEKLLLTVLDENHLFYGIGDKGTDTVFMRSFSNLIIAAILYTDAREPMLAPDLIAQTREALLRYAQSEHDWRGYVAGKGWAHAMAHLADALDECAQHPATTSADREKLLTLLSGLVKIADPLYHEEDMRLATVVYHIILGKQVSDSFLVRWLDSCFVERDAVVTTWVAATNPRNFLRSLYFLILWGSVAMSLADRIVELLRKQDAVYID